MSFLLTELPPGAHVDCFIGRVEALKEMPTTVKDPELSVNGNRLLLPVTLENNQYLELWDEGRVKHYDQNGHLLEQRELEGGIPPVEKGSNRVEFRSASYKGDREQVRIEIITMGDLIEDQ